MQLEFDLFCEGFKDVASCDCGAGDAAVQRGWDAGIDEVDVHGCVCIYGLDKDTNKSGTLLGCRKNYYLCC